MWTIAEYNILLLYKILQDIVLLTLPAPIYIPLQLTFSLRNVYIFKKAWNFLTKF